MINALPKIEKNKMMAKATCPCNFKTFERFFLFFNFFLVMQFFFGLKLRKKERSLSNMGGGGSVHH